MQTYTHGRGERATAIRANSSEKKSRKHASCGSTTDNPTAEVKATTMDDDEYFL